LVVHEQILQALFRPLGKSKGEVGMQIDQHARSCYAKKLAYGLALVLFCLPIATAQSPVSSEAQRIVAPMPQRGELFGSALATGDVNGDGLADIVVGAEGSARVYIYFGGPTIGENRTMLEGPAGSGFGAFVATGRVNSDTVADILVGAPDATVGTNAGAGLLYIYFGGQTIAPRPNPLQAPTPQPRAQFGVSAAAGDFNGDMMPDLLVGANRADVTVMQDSMMVTRVDAGQAFVFFGPGFDMGTQTLQASMTPEADVRFGTAVAAVNFNNEGPTDMVITADAANVAPSSGATAETNAGEAFVFFGTMVTMGTMFDTTSDVNLRGTIQRGASFGRSITVGDFNADNIGDVVIGAPFLDLNPSFRDVGELSLFTGAAMITTSTGMAIRASATPSFSYFGFSAALGDVNGDGLQDLIGGAPGSEVANEKDAGRAFLLINGALPSAPPFVANIPLQANDPQAGAQFGWAVAIADLNGDGLEEIIISARSEDVRLGEVELRDAGAIYIFSPTVPPPPIIDK
jgi:hypothetical protein